MKIISDREVGLTKLGENCKVKMKADKRLDVQINPSPAGLAFGVMVLVPHHVV